jgi:uncharacterized membrane protein (GlpM family)
MRRARLVCALVLAVAAAVAVPAASAPPESGIFVPGESLGGARLGMTKEDVLDAWGTKHGVCTNCDRTTWYFNSAPFAPEGVGAVFVHGRAVHLFTVWKPVGWHTSDGLELGVPEADVATDLVVSEERTCDGYTATIAPGNKSVSAFYIFRGELWGFGLLRPELNPCL